MRPVSIVLRVVLIGSLLGIGACKKPSGELSRPDLSNRKLQVLATTGMIADAARAVGGEHVDVDCLMGPPIDPHMYTAAARGPDADREGRSRAVQRPASRRKDDRLFEERAKTEPGRPPSPTRLLDLRRPRKATKAHTTRTFGSTSACG